MKRGFSLLEALLGIAMVLALSGALVSFLWGLMERRDALVAGSVREAGIDLLFDEIESCLTTTFVSDAEGNAGIAGGAGRLAVRGRGVPMGGGPDVRGCEAKAEDGRVVARRTEVEGGFETLAEGVGRLDARFYMNGEWKTEFDSAAAGALPAAVELAVWFGPDTEQRAADRVRVMVVPDAVAGVTP